MLVGGGLPRKALALRREPGIGVMRAALMQQPVRENIYRAVASGLVRPPVRPSCIAGAGSSGAPGISSPAIKRPCGVNPRRGEGQGP